MDQPLLDCFLRDLKRFMLDFLNDGNLEFPYFLKVWKKHNLNLVFIGTANEVELSEYTNDFFNLVLQFIGSSNPFECRIAAIYVLFALYRSQILSPPVPIRIRIDQWNDINRIIESLPDRAKFKHFLVIVDYLWQNAFALVYCTTLMGPTTCKCNPRSEKSTFLPLVALDTVREEIKKMYENNVLGKFDSIFNRYLSFVEKVGLPVSKDLQNPLEDLQKGLKKLVVSGKTSQKPLDEDIGRRRVKLKDKALGFCFSRQSSDEDKELFQRFIPKKRTHQKRVPKAERKMGRPKKVQNQSPEKKIVKTPPKKLLLGKKGRIRASRLYAANDNSQSDDSSISENDLPENPENQELDRPLENSDFLLTKMFLSSSSDVDTP